MGTTVYEFGDFRFDPGSGQLLGEGRERKLRLQAAQTLELLLKAAGEVVSREELRRELWPDKRVVSFEASICAVIRELRRALGDEANAPRYIETIPRRGYRFIALVEPRDGSIVRAPAPHPQRLFGRDPAGVVVRAVALASLLTAASLMGGSGSVPPPWPGGFGEGTNMVLALQPFRVLDAGSRRPAFAVALEDELATVLARAPLDRLGVVRAPSPDTLPMGTTHVLEGSLRAGQESFEFTVRVAAANSGSLVWSDRYPVPDGADALAVRKISVRIADAVLQQVLPSQSGGAVGASAVPLALEKWREARRVLAAKTAEATSDAIAILEEAVTADADFVPAQTALAEALLRWPGPRKTAESVQRARVAAQRALLLAPADGSAHRVLGEIALFHDRDWGEAESRLERAVSLSPGNAVTRDSYAAWLSARGRHDEALREIELAEALDPAAAAISIDVMLFHYYARDFEGSLQAARRLAMLWPGNIMSDLYTVLANLGRGDVAAAAEQARRTMAGWQSTVGDESSLPSVDEEALALFWRRYLWGVKRLSDPERVAIAVAEAQLGELDEAAAHIDAAVDEQSFSYAIPFLGVNPALDPLRGRPDFERTLRSLGQAALSNFYRSTVIASDGE